jgi:hypothetical protein
MTDLIPEAQDLTSLLAVEALVAQGQESEAGALLDDAMQRFPALLWPFARHAGLPQDPAIAQQRWAVVALAFPAETLPVLGEIDAWLRQAGPVEATEVLEAARGRGCWDRSLERRWLEIAIGHDVGGPTAEMACRLIHLLADAEAAPDAFAAPLALLAETPEALLRCWLALRQGPRPSCVAAAQAAFVAFIDARPAALATDLLRVAIAPPQGVADYAALLSRCLGAYRADPRFLMGFAATLPVALREQALRRFVYLEAAWEGLEAADEVAFCLLVAASVTAAELRHDVIRRIRARKAGISDAPGSVGELISGIARRAVLPEERRPVPAGPQRLRVAICVSGALGGFQAAFESWGNLGLADHDVTVFAHVWHHVGGVVARSGVDLARALGGRLGEALLGDPAAGDLAALAQLYPALLDGLAKGLALAPEDVARVYQTPHVAMEDAHDPRFQGFDAARRDAYKVWAVGEMAQRHPQSFDLLIHLRPDLAILPGATLDWEGLAAESRARRLVVCDRPAHVTEGFQLAMGTGLVAGAPEPMAALARVWPLVAEWEETRPFGLPVDFAPQGRFAHALLFEGVETRGLAGLEVGATMPPSRLDRSRVGALLAQDCAAREVTDFDRVLLRAAMEDVQAG